MSQLNLFKILSLRPKASVNLQEFEGLPVHIRRRAYQRSMNVRLAPSGEIRVTCGRMIKDQEIQKFLLELKPWLKKGLEELELRRRQFPQLNFLEGEVFPFLGEKYQLSFDNSQCKRLAFELKEPQLLCRWPSAAERPTDEHLSLALRRFYKKAAQHFLQTRVNFYSQQMGLAPKTLSFRLQKSRWGSCSSSGTISLNIKLMAFPAQVIDYVIVHELAHLKFANHGQDFWALVEQHCRDFRQHRKWLKKAGYWIAASLPLR